jgi:hypothetical protein
MCQWILIRAKGDSQTCIHRTPDPNSSFSEGRDPDVRENHRQAPEVIDIPSGMRRGPTPPASVQPESVREGKTTPVPSDPEPFRESGRYNPR